MLENFEDITGTLHLVQVVRGAIWGKNLNHFKYVLCNV